jgi:hypothetical protein
MTREEREELDNLVSLVFSDDKSNAKLAFTIKDIQI